MVYNETESVETIAKEISEEMQMATQYGGIRPYAISLLIGGIDRGPKLFEIEPGASYLGYKADAIGSGKSVAQEMLVKSFKENMDTEEALKLGVSIIKKLNEGKLTENNLDISTIKKDVGIEIFTSEKVAKYL
jgi:proteasome alpha subunit